MIKSTIVMFLTIFLIFIASGCQKDSIASKQENSSNQTEISTSKKNKQVSEKSGIETEKDNAVKTNTKTETNAQENSKTIVKSDEKPNSPTTKQDSQQQVTKKETTNSNPSSTTVVSKPKTNTQTNTKPVPKKTVPQSFVTISIISSDLQKTIVASTKVTIEDGEPLLNATRELLKQKGIGISVRGSGATAYVEGIGDLYEFDHGPLSGWIAKKNGAVLDRSSGLITVKNGDSIQWNYTTDYTKEK